VLLQSRENETACVELSRSELSVYYIRQGRYSLQQHEMQGLAKHSYARRVWGVFGETRQTEALTIREKGEARQSYAIWIWGRYGGAYCVDHMVGIIVL
jgi:hypothetical protein